MQLIDSIVTEAAALTALRRDLHAHPELCFEELRTAEVVAAQLTAWGVCFASIVLTLSGIFVNAVRSLLISSARMSRSMASSFANCARLRLSNGMLRKSLIVCRLLDGCLWNKKTC